MTEADLSLSFGLTTDHDTDLGSFPSSPSAFRPDCLTNVSHKCPVCAQGSVDAPTFNLSHCSGCGHIFQTDMKITAVYDAAYAHKHDKYPVAELSNLRWEFIQSRLNLPRQSAVLDVGYGNGGFLKRAREAGMNVFGIEVHKEDFGVPVVDFDHPIEYDLIAFFDSLEHFAEFHPIYRLRARNVIVSLPRTPDFLLETPTVWRHYRPGEHMHYFSTESLDRFMRNWGFPIKICDGYPEDRIRGKLNIGGSRIDNIYTSIYTSKV